MSGDDRRDRVVDAFDAAVSWWHQQLDEPIEDHEPDNPDSDDPASAREYFEQVRGFDAGTLDEWRLGWAPPEGGLYDHLSELGFNAEIISATGLFCKSNPEKELWSGRYVMPYFNADGRAEYAIARCTGSKGGGRAGYDGNPADFLSGKYAKVAHTRDDVPLSEPILGLHTLDDADEVVVAEGIADAITAHEAGHAVLSPVTKEFKQEHFDEVIDAVKEHGIERVYVVPDAELAGFTEIDSDDVPDEPENAFEAINIPTVAPGPGGGLRTANYLVEHDIDARVVDLPRPSSAKVDLDDYLQEWSGSLDAALRSAKPPEEHPQYDAATATQDTDGDSESGSNNSDTETPGASGRSSASGLFDLDVGDVNPDLSAGYRGKNPLGHQGSSENYFVVNEHPKTEDLIGKDYKRPGNPRYTGCTYLLVDIEERPVEGPMGPLSPEETWLAWSEARERGILGPDDKIPVKALEHVARENELYDFDAIDLGDEDELPAKAYNHALWWVNGSWPDSDGVDVDTDDEENVTSRSGRPRDAGPARTWEDVRYIYEVKKESGRAAARELLSDRYDFMTLPGDEDLKVYDTETGVYTDETSEVNGEIYNGLGEEWSTHELNEIKAGLRQLNMVNPQDLNGYGLDGPHICVNNGVLDLLNREHKDHSPDYYFTDRVPVAYDPNADTAPHEEFVDELVGREADKKVLFEMVGHALLPDANERYKKFLILTGNADNGKSAFYSRVKALLNGPNVEEKNVSSVKLAKLAQNRFSMNSMYGSMANIAGEIDGKKIRNTANIKDITGGDIVEIEPKGIASFFDTINTTLMFAANDPPLIGERDKEAIATRLVPVDLPYVFTDNPEGPNEKEAVDKSVLKERLDTPGALSGLLNLALDGIERLEANNGDVSLPEAPPERLRMYERSADPMREFGERCLKNSAGDYVVKGDVTAIYKEFAVSEGYEVGSNINSVLHDVLRGVPSLNYTESRPMNPDYSDTDVPLRGWDERKWVVDRVALTEEGLKHAEAVGLVDETPEESEEGVGLLTLEDLSMEHPAVDNCGRIQRPIEVEISTAYPNQYSRLVGTLEDESGTFDYYTLGSAERRLKDAVGAKFNIVGAKIETDDKTGALQLRLDPDAAYKLVSSPVEVDDENTGEAQAAPDGGTESEPGGTHIQRVVETVREASEPLGVAEIVREAEGDPGKLRVAVSQAVKSGRIREEGDDQYALD